MGHPIFCIYVIKKAEERSFPTIYNAPETKFLYHTLYPKLTEKSYKVYNKLAQSSIFFRLI